MSRALTACALLVGLALMHSLGAVIGTGCAGGTPPTTPMTSMSAVVASSAQHGATTDQAAMVRSGTTVAIGVDTTALSAASRDAGPGSVCDSTPPGRGMTGLPAPAATGLSQPAVLDPPASDSPQPGGALPRAGPALLISLCISRT